MRAISEICKSQPLIIELVHTYRLTINLQYTINHMYRLTINLQYTINHTTDSRLAAYERKGSAVRMLNYDVMYEINGKICVAEIMLVLN